MKFYPTCLFMATVFSLTCLQSFSQNLPGSIIRQATNAAGRLVLDPNADGFTSASVSGFGNNDVTNSELIYKAIKAQPIEPYSDLRRGPNHNYSDYVPDADGNGVYHLFTAAQNLLFRMRLGSIMPGSKGYSILMDTDGKFGAAGPNADPNYQPATTGTNGNPGFEIEIVLETNFRIAIYNVDGTSSPVMIKQYLNWQDMSQVSIASTNDDGNPDFLIDFYIPFSDLQAAPFNLTTASPIRMTATTVMSPQAAIGGPRSDIYGVAGNSYEDFIDAQPSCNIFNVAATCITNMCTAAPSVNSPILTGTINISGTWTKSPIAGAASIASISIYKNGIILNTIPNVNSGSPWTLNNITLVNGDVITAKAVATGETMCLTSNGVTASTCNFSNRPATPVLTCSSGNKGFGGTNLTTGWKVNVDNITRNVLDNNVTNVAGLFGAVTGTSPNLNWVYSGGCSTGAPLTSGSYKVYYTDTLTGCVSSPAYFCAIGSGNGNALAGSLAAPTITTPSNNVFSTATTSIAGTTDPSASVSLFVNGRLVQNITATGTGSFTFPNLNLLVSQQIYITVELNTGTVSTSKCANQSLLYTVTCYTNPPGINADVNNQLTAGAPITGTSSDPAGTLIRVYNSANTLLATTAAQANGTWSTGSAGTTPAVLNAIAATSYYANAQNGTCGVSTNSGTYVAATATLNTRCGSITGPITSGVTSVSGTLSGSFTSTKVNLYLDGELIGSTTTNTAAWGPITVNTTATNTLYSNGVLSIGIQETSKQEVVCPSSNIAIQCSPSPTIPLYSLSSNSINQFETVTCTITNAVTGTFYALYNPDTGASLGQGKWATANGNLVLVSAPFSDPGTYNTAVKSSMLTGLTICTGVSASVALDVKAVTVPLTIIDFKGMKQSPDIVLKWITENEIDVNRFEIERSNNGNSFTKIGETNSLTNSNSRKQYAFIDVSPYTSNNFYRLKIIDNNAKFSYSNMIAFSNNAVQDMIISSVTPNPFKESVKLMVILAKPTMLNLQITDFTGRIMYTKNVQGAAGTNTIICSDLGKLAEGLHIISVKSEENVLKQKLLKIK